MNFKVSILISIQISRGMGVLFRSERDDRKFANEATPRRVPAGNNISLIEMVHRRKGQSISPREMEALLYCEREAAGTAPHRTYHIGGTCSAYTAMICELMR
jgi:hypothetical protein